MEFRKLISFGKSSYVISLPKSWVTKHNIKKGDLISVEESGPKLILSRQKDVSDQEEKEITINVDGKVIMESVREINTAYITNHKRIILEGRELKEKSKDILAAVRELMALEVLEVESSRIVTEDFLDMKKISINQLVKKMDITVRSMIQDTFLSFDEKNASNIALRDADVSRISFLIFRAIRYGLRNQTLILKQQKLSAIDLLNYYLLVLNLEFIGSETKRISRCMNQVECKGKLKNNYLSLLEEIQSQYLSVIKAYYAEDYQKGISLSKFKKEAYKKLDTLFESFDSKNKHTVFLFDATRDLIRSIHETSRLIYQK